MVSGDRLVWSILFRDFWPLVSCLSGSSSQSHVFSAHGVECSSVKEFTVILKSPRMPIFQLLLKMKTMGVTDWLTSTGSK
ncbi:hypothetical protein TKK_0018659 [Trichogramma kaykai]